MTASRYCLKDLADSILLERLTNLVGRGNAITADILAHFAEVDARKLYLEQGFPSLFAYAVEACGFSEGSAYKRIAAARAARRFPILFDLVERGEVHLSSVTLLAPHLSQDNHRELLAAAAHQSKRVVQQLMATRFPSPDAPSLLRKLPSRIPAAPLVASAATLPPSPQPGASGVPGVATTAAPAAAAMPSHTEPASRPLLLPPSDTSSAVAPSHQIPASTVTPLSAHRYRLQVTLSQTARDALQRASELLGTTVDSRDLAAICELALTSLVARLEKKKFAKSTRPRGGNRQPPAGLDELPAAPPLHAEPLPLAHGAATTPEPQKSPREPKPRSRHIPAAVRRAVAERDGYQCTFLGTNGRRCPERRHLEFHHDQAFCRGGPTAMDNLKLACRAHHAHHTERDFGTQWIKDRIAMKREPMARLGLTPGAVAASP